MEETKPPPPPPLTQRVAAQLLLKTLPPAASTPVYPSGILDVSPSPAAWVLVGVDKLPPSWDPIVTPKFGELWQARWPSHQFSGE